MAPPKNEQFFQEQLAKKRWEFWCSLPERLLDLSNEVSRLLEEDDRRDRLQNIYMLLHRMVGSAGTLGQLPLSDEARQFEQKVKALLNDGKTLQHANLDWLKPMSSRLSAVIVEPDGKRVDVVAARVPVEGQKSLIGVLESAPSEFASLERQLSPFNYRLQHFEHPLSAVSAGTVEGPQLVLINLSSFYDDACQRQALEAFCQRLEEQRIQVLFLAEEDRFDFRVFAAKKMAVGLFVKPLSVPKLTARIDQALARLSAPPERVMVVDDDDALAEHYKLVLEGAGMTVKVLRQADRIMDELTQFRPELVLMDLHMPEYSGTDLAAVIRQYDQWESLPIVYLSSETDMAEQIRAMRFGADDFLCKPVLDAQLVAAVHARIERARRLADQITKDSLTGLLRHASIKEHVAQEASRAMRDGQPLSVAMIDIDFFKSVNDTYGHPGGDLVISSLATLLKQRVRASDIVGRYGGEEFVVVLPNCDRQFAETILDNIRKLFARIDFDSAGKTFHCTFSAGIGVLDPSLGEKEEDLIAAADAALYRAKNSGRDRVM
ncbi:diguanylate cyclase [Marinimicrobium agarilyticum]|uniref:diguanylate cyclase n=1 Tax=Marinimicrobium agarilyticum TaxID=306546 RepID=UPI0003F917E1|nr:diguanylate cyclase [Marinimicrobium agarilyticum]